MRLGYFKDRKPDPSSPADGLGKANPGESSVVVSGKRTGETRR
jgi:hypothetical protein